MIKKQFSSTLILFLLLVGITMPVWSGTISGIIKSDKGRLVKDARIKAWDKDTTSKDDLLGEATSNEQGKYTINYAEKLWDGSNAGPNLKANSPDIYITVEIKVRGKWEVIAKSKVYKNQDPEKPLRIDLVNVDRINAFVRRTIYGVIKNKNGEPMVAYTVKAWDKDWGGKADLMGSAVTNRHGEYRISYDKRRWDSGLTLGKSNYPDIFITVIRKKDNKTIAKSAVFKDHPIDKRLKINIKLK